MDSSTSKAKKTSQSEKKLKQTRLPFQKITVSPKESAPPCKKLKFDDDTKSSLTNNVETKENFKIESDKKNMSEEKSVIHNDDSDSIQLIESFSIQNSPKKGIKERNLDFNSLEERGDKLGPVETVIATIGDAKENVILSGANLQSKSSDKSETPKSECEKKSKLAAMFDSAKRKISQQEEDKESNVNKKAKLDSKNETVVSVNEKSGSDTELVNSESNINHENSKEPAKDNNLVNESVSQNEISKIKSDVSTEIINSPDDVVIIDGPNLNKVETIMVNEQDDTKKTENSESDSRHIIFHDFDSKPSSSSNNNSLVTPPRSKKPAKENSDKKLAKKLTPKQLQNKAESAKKREERERLLEEKRKKREDEKEEKRRKKEEKEEERRRQKEEKEKKRQMELDLKNEEKKKKEEERRKKEEQKAEEKRKKEEELQRKKEEENQQKKKFTKEAEAFSNFFKKVEVESGPVIQAENKSSNFLDFKKKPDMRLAPINRNPMEEDSERRSEFEELFKSQATVETYLTELRSKKIKPKKSCNTWPLEEKYEEILVIEEEFELNDAPNSAVVPGQKNKNSHVKLLQFHENRRPPYWGTWRKKSKNITARRPFGKDTIFDYEVDSDDEWEEEEPGESLHGSDDEKEPEDDYEVDNDFFVPHGYLSDDENPEDENLTPETQKAKLKLLGEQFDLERNEKTKQLRPVTIGCIWFKNDSDEPEGVNPSVIKLLYKRKAVLWVETKPIIIEDAAETSEKVSGNTTPSSSKKAKFPESGVPFLISMLHGNTCSKKNIIQKFLLHWKDEENQVPQGDNNANIITKASISKKIKELSSWQEYPEEGSFFGKYCWFVKKEFREMYGLKDLPLPNKWDSSITLLDGNPDSAKITKFTKILTEEERKKQLEMKINMRKSINTSDKNSPSSGKKSAKKLFQFLSKQPSQPHIARAQDMGVVPIDQKEIVESKNKDGCREKIEEKKVLEIVIDDDSNGPKKEAEDSKEGNKSNNAVDDKVEVKGNSEVLPATANKNSIIEISSSIISKSDAENNMTRKKDNVSESDQKIDVKNNVENDTKKLSHELKLDTKNLVPSISSKINVENLKPIVKKRVPILFSAPRGCEIKKAKEEEKVENESGTVAKEDNSNNKNHEIPSGSKSENESVKQVKVLKTEALIPAPNVKADNEQPKPVVKKRVPILFSAPRGCEIKKPSSSANETPKPTTD